MNTPKSKEQLANIENGTIQGAGECSVNACVIMVLWSVNWRTILVIGSCTHSEMRFGWLVKKWDKKRFSSQSVCLFDLKGLGYYFYRVCLVVVVYNHTFELFPHHRLCRWYRMTPWFYIQSIVFCFQISHARHLTFKM